MLISVMLCSHQGADQLDCPDHLNNPMKIDQARLNEHLKTPARRQGDTTRFFYHFFTTKEPDQHPDFSSVTHTYTRVTRLTGPLLDHCQISTRPDRNDRNPVVNGRVSNCLE